MNTANECVHTAGERQCRSKHAVCLKTLTLLTTQRAFCPSKYSHAPLWSRRCSGGFGSCRAHRTLNATELDDPPLNVVPDVCHNGFASQPIPNAPLRCFLHCLQFIFLSLELLCQGQALALIESQLYLQLVVGHNLAARPGLSGAKVWVVGWQASRHLLNRPIKPDHHGLLCAVAAAATEREREGLKYSFWYPHQAVLGNLP
mmetsp:Transcript_1950/g.4366  ORF Transcript_1950/g.4366 Transcript_1950/m.4366 type:complete len:202 (+) Transcript_1950:576-1181(+)